MINLYIMTEKLTTEVLLKRHEQMLEEAIEKNNRQYSLITRAEVGRLVRLVNKFRYAL